MVSQSPKSTQRVPTVRPMSWLATVPQFLMLALAIATACFLTQSSNGVVWGAAVYLIYSFGSRQLIPRAHCRGMRLAQRQQFEPAIHAYQQSYEFFTRYPWLDRYRSITMMSPSAMSYREMALVNIAFAHSQIGNGAQAKACYQRTLEEFPNNSMAIAALRMIESVEQSHSASEDETQ